MANTVQPGGQISRLWVIVKRAVLIPAIPIVAAVCMSAASLHAQSNSAFAVDTLDDLYQVDLATATKTLIGSTGQFLEGLALSPKGPMFGIDSGGSLYRVNKTTGATTFIGATGLGDIESLGFLNNTLLAIPLNGPPEVVALDTSTAKFTVIVTSKQAVGAIRSMAIATSHSIIICADQDPSGTQTGHSLYSMDLVAGKLTFIGTLNIGTNILLPAMAFNKVGQLFGLDQNGNEWKIDPATAAVTLIGNTGGTFWLDMTTGAQPKL